MRSFLLMLVLAVPALAESAASSPARFQDDVLLAHVEFLASDDLEGRGCGSDGLAAAAAYVEERFREYGLKAAGDEGTFRQTWTGTCADGDSAEMVNLVGVLPGERPDWRDQSVVLVAHYDHLGRGWPDVHEGDAGEIHNGADDNASGVAVLLEIARSLSTGGVPPRSIVFLAVSGEEMGLRGSRHYVETAIRYPAASIVGAVNLDTIGRLGDGSLLILGAGSAREWAHLFRGVGHVTGVSLKVVTDDPGGSDQKSFIDAGVPAVQLFTGPHLDYHRPGDDTDKIDVTGLVSVAEVTLEAVEYLASREDRLTATLGEEDEAPADPPKKTSRRASLGGIPDFSFEGEGYRLSGVSPGSGAEAAGLAAGDVIVRIGERPIAGLRDVSEVLKTLAPGDPVAVVYVREGEQRTAEVVLGAR